MLAASKNFRLKRSKKIEILRPKQTSFHKIVLITVSMVCAFILFIPFFSVYLSWAGPVSSIWEHLISTSFVEYAVNTFALTASVVSCSVILGVFFAGITTFYDFPLRKLISALCYTPLVFPPYVLGFVFLGIFDVTGPVAKIATHLGYGYNELPDIRGLLGASISLSISLFPYVYMLTKTAMISQGPRVFEAGRSLGLRPSECVLKIGFPLSRPWIFSGALIVMMEVMADFGTVSVFSLDTFTTGIFKSWYGFFDFAGALQLSSVLLTIMMIVQYLKVKNEALEARFQTDLSSRGSRLKVSKAAGYFLCVGSLFLFTFMVGIPFVQLASWVLELGLSRAYSIISENLLNTILISGIAAALILLVSLLIKYHERMLGFLSKKMRFLLSLPSIGYGFPGAVLAAGLVMPFNYFDSLLNDNGLLSGSFLGGSLAVLLAGLFIRFYVVGFSSVSGGFGKIPRSMDEASKSMGVKGLNLFSRIHLPLLKHSIFVGFIYTFIDVAKEMPLTLMARPTGWDTLSVKIFEWTSEGEWEKAAVPSLILVCLGMISLWLTLAGYNKSSEFKKG